jgi:hypothetical protein
MQLLGVVLMQHPSCSQIAPRAADETSQFIALSMINARQVVSDATHAAHQGVTQLSLEHQQELYCTGAADYAVRMGSNLSLQTRQVLGRGFGRNVEVNLPSGELFNSRAISSNSNAHASNNWFVAGANVRAVAVGMHDNLNPDYTRLLPDFVKASSNLRNLVSTFDSLINVHDNSVAALSASTNYNDHKRELIDFFGNDEDEMVRVAIARSTNNTTGNDDNGGGEPRAKMTTYSTGDGDMNLLQTSAGSSP